MTGVRKGRGKELGRETVREGGGFLSFLPRAPKFPLTVPLPLLTPATQAKVSTTLNRNVNRYSDSSGSEEERVRTGAH